MTTSELTYLHNIRPSPYAQERARTRYARLAGDFRAAWTNLAPSGGLSARADGRVTPEHVITVSSGEEPHRIEEV